MLADLLEGGEIGETLPEAARPMFVMTIDMLAVLDRRIAELDNASHHLRCLVRARPALLNSRHRQLRTCNRALRCQGGGF